MRLYKCIPLGWLVGRLAGYRICLCVQESVRYARSKVQEEEEMGNETRQGETERCNGIQRRQGTVEAR